MAWQTRSLALLSLFLVSNSTAQMWSCSPPPASTSSATVLEEVPAEIDWQAQRLATLRKSIVYALQQESVMGKELATQVLALVERESQRHELSPLWLLALILAESRGDPQAISPKGARGLMQVLPPTGRFIAAHLSEKWRGASSLHEVETNIRYGAWYLSYLQQMFEGDRQAALAAYNWGPEEIQNRIERERDLPQIYPQLVQTAKERLEERMHDYYQVYVWGRPDNPEH